MSRPKSNVRPGCSSGTSGIHSASCRVPCSRILAASLTYETCFAAWTSSAALRVAMKAMEMTSSRVPIAFAAASARMASSLWETFGLASSAAAVVSTAESFHALERGYASR